MSVREAGTIYQFACAENLGANTLAVGFLYYSETLGLVASLNRAWYWGSAIKKRCIGTSLGATNAYFLVHEEND